MAKPHTLQQQVAAQAKRLTLQQRQITILHRRIAAVEKGTTRVFAACLDVIKIQARKP